MAVNIIPENDKCADSVFLKRHALFVCLFVYKRLNIHTIIRMRYKRRKL
jgi:hypothetical protein